MKSTKRYTNFDEVGRDLNALFDAVNKPQASVGKGSEGKSGDLRLTVDDGGYAYIEGKGNEGWLTSFMGVMVDKPQRGRPYPYFPLLEVDNLYAKVFTVNQTTSSNGNMIMSDYGIVEAHTKTTITFKDQSNLNLCGFAVNDTCEVRQVKADKSGDIKTKINFTITAVSGRTVTVTYSGADLVSDGDIVVRVGNTTTAARQNSIYFSTSDTNSPYIDFYSGTTLYTLSTPKVRIGKLDGVGSLTGMGLYAIDNIHLSKITAGVGIHLTTGTTTTITSGFAVFDPAEGRMHLGNTTNYVRWNYDETAPFKDKLVITGDVVLGNNNAIMLGKTAYTDTVNAGFWLGDSDATATVNPYFYLGNAGDTKYLKVDTIAGTFNTLGFTITGGTIQTATSGARVMLSTITGVGTITIYDGSGSVGTVYGNSGNIGIGGNLLLDADKTFMVSTTGGVQTKIDPLYGYQASYFDGANYPSSVLNSEGIYFGVPATRYGSYDTNLYRSAANVLKTDDNFQCLNITAINGVTYSFPSVAPTLNQVLGCSNATGGVLTWRDASSGTVTSVAMTVPTGLSISGSPITTSGTLAVTLTAGYVIPTTTEQTNWGTAYTNRITSLTTTGSSGAATLVSNTLNIPNYTLAGLGGTTLAAVLANANSFSNANSFNSVTATTFLYGLSVGYHADASKGFVDFLNGDLLSAYKVRVIAGTITASDKTITLPNLTGTVLLTTSSAGSFPTLNQNTTGNAATVTNGVYTNANNSLTGNNTTTGSVMFDGELESTPGGDPTSVSITGKNTLILYMTDAYTVNLTNPTDGQLLFVSNDKDSPASAIISPVRNGANTTLTLLAGNSVMLRYRSSETTWYSTGQ